MSGMRRDQAGDNAEGCLSVLLRMQQLRRTTPAETRQLLRILFLRVDTLPTQTANPIPRRPILVTPTV